MMYDKRMLYEARIMAEKYGEEIGDAERLGENWSCRNAWASMYAIMEFLLRVDISLSLDSVIMAFTFGYNKNCNIALLSEPSRSLKRIAEEMRTKLRDVS
jgi:hypothetical protein